MIKTNELRIGNYVIKTKTGKCHRLSANDIANFASSSLMQPMFQPIPITPDWLLRGGFCEDDTLSFNLPDGYEVVFMSDSTIYFRHEVMERNIVKIKYIHQLQNIYFDLEGEELTFKEA